jgi:hypothetical protein
MTIETSVKSSYGGKREGAGSKPSSKGGITKPKRIPIKYIDIVDELIKHLDNSSEIISSDDKLNSKAFSYMSASDNKQKIIFTVSGDDEQNKK